MNVLFLILIISKIYLIDFVESKLLQQKQNKHASMQRINSPEPDDCGYKAMQCYREVLYYLDQSGKICGWKQVDNFRNLPAECQFFNIITEFSNPQAKYYRIWKRTCDLYATFKHCLNVIGVCKKDNLITTIDIEQQQYCNNLELIRDLKSCHLDWSFTNWTLAVYNDFNKGCSMGTYSQLGLDLIRIMKVRYLSIIRSVDLPAEDNHNPLLAQVYARYKCQQIKFNACNTRQINNFCSGYIKWFTIQTYGYKALENDVQMQNFFYYAQTMINIRKYCPFNNKTGYVEMHINDSDILPVYDRHQVEKESSIWIYKLEQLQLTSLSPCNPANILIQQLKCYNMYMLTIDLTKANIPGYLGTQLCNRLHIYDVCFKEYTETCSEQILGFSALRDLLTHECELLVQAARETRCPLYDFYALGAAEGIGHNSKDNNIHLLLSEFTSLFISLHNILNPISPRNNKIAEMSLANMEGVEQYMSTFSNKLFGAGFEESKNIISLVCSQKSIQCFSNYVSALISFHKKYDPALLEGIRYTGAFIKSKYNIT